MSYTLELWKETEDPEWENTECITIDDIILDEDKFTDYIELMIQVYLKDQDDKILDDVNLFLKNLHNGN